MPFGAWPGYFGNEGGRSATQCACDQGDERFTFERLQQIRSARSFGLHAHCRIVMSGDEYPRRHGSMLCQPPVQLETGHARQPDIAHQAVDGVPQRRAFQRVQQRFRRFVGIYLIAGTAQHALDCLAHARVVLNQYHLVCRARHAGLSGPARRICRRRISTVPSSAVYGACVIAPWGGCRCPLGQGTAQGTDKWPPPRTGGRSPTVREVMLLFFPHLQPKTRNGMPRRVRVAQLGVPAAPLSAHSIFP